jgi:hypothetical protein
MAGKKKAGSKIKLALTLVDAIWTRNERKGLIHHDLDRIEAHRMLEKIVERCCLAAHVLRSHTLPARPTPSGQSGSQILGIGNALIRYNKNEKLLEKYVPQWHVDGHPIPAGRTLQSVVDQKVNLIKARNNVTNGFTTRA